ncbi:MAG TPA: transporter, partial [bacterium]|nr:transporter [bacterium]
EFKTSTATEGPTGSLLFTSPGVGSKGNKSIGTGLSYVNLDGDISDDLYQFPVSFSYTPIDKLDLTIALPVIKIEDIDAGLGDIYASAKIGLDILQNYDMKSAFMFGLGLPTGAERFTGTDNKMDIMFDFPVEKEFENCVLNLDLGLSYFDINSDNKENIFKIACGISRSFTKNIGGSIDMVYQDGSTFSSLIAGLGLKYNLNSNQSANLSIGRDLHKSGLDLLVSFGFSNSF